MSSIASGTTTTTSLSFSGDTSGVLQLQTNGTTTAVTIDTSQRVGIGTASPSYLLDISSGAVGASNLRIATTTASYGANLILQGTTTSKNWSVSSSFANAGDLAFVPSTTNGGVTFTTAAMTLNNSGFLGLGTSSGSAPSYPLDIETNAQGNGSWVSWLYSTNNVSGDGVQYLRLRANANNTSSYFLACNVQAVGDKLYIYGNGNVVNANNSYGTLSDAKIKTNIVLADTQWNDVKALGQVMKKFNLLSDPTGPLQLGWVAQDVKAISSGLVFSQPDLNPETNEPLGTETLGVNTSIAMLKAFKALSEALVRIETLEAEVTTLQSQVAALTPKA